MTHWCANVILHLPQWLEGIFQVTERRSENLILVAGGGKTNKYYLFGGKDESSAALIQGMTLSGVLFDEVALMPKSFVEQALARCSVEGSRFWFNCNPENPAHWFYKEWIKRADQHHAVRLHFKMEDNYSLAPSIKQRYENMYAGVFKKRFIDGEWVAASGLIYPMFSTATHIIHEIPEEGRCYLSIDYGTYNPFSAGLWRVTGGKAYRIKEYYYSGREAQGPKTDEEYYIELERLAAGFQIQCVVIDPSAASMIECIKRHRVFRVRMAFNEVLPGIRRTAALLNSKKLLFSSDCKDSIREFGIYAWDEKRQDDKPIKENDHAMDDIRYFVNTVLRKEFRGERWD